MKEENTDESYIGLICNGEFNAIRDFKIGELFESFFDNINYNEEPCTILIRFKIDNDDEFEINFVKVNDDALDEEETLDLLDDIAFAGGAILDDEDYCYNCDMEECSHCMHNLDSLEDFEDCDESLDDNNDDDND